MTILVTIRIDGAATEYEGVEIKAIAADGTQSDAGTLYDNTPIAGMNRQGQFTLYEGRALLLCPVMDGKSYAERAFNPLKEVPSEKVHIDTATTVSSGDATKAATGTSYTIPGPYAPLPSIEDGPFDKNCTLQALQDARDAIKTIAEDIGETQRVGIIQDALASADTEIVRLERELADMTDDYFRLLREKQDALNASLLPSARGERDAERYRWLREHTYVEGYWIDGAGGVDTAIRVQGAVEHLDAAIDKEMNK